MAGFLVAAAEAIQGLQCQLLGANEYIVGSVGRFAGPVRDRALDGLKAQRRLLGCDPAEDVDPPAPPFTGGQCDGPYLLNVTRDFGGSITTFTTLVHGPIGGVRAFVDGGQTKTQAFVRDARAGQSTCGSTFPGDPAWFDLGSNTGSPIGGTVTVNSASPCPGNPDSCGDPPPVYPPPVNVDYDIDITYQPDFGPEITVPITVDFSPTEVNFNGDLQFPFNFDFGGFEFTGNLSFNPEVNVRINPPSRLPRGTGQPTETLPPQVDPQPVEPAEFDRIIIGVAVQSTIVGEQQFTTIDQTGQPEIFAPRSASVKFAYSIGIATFWSSDIDVKGRNVFIPCPFSQGADAVNVSPAPGVAVTFQPVYGFPLATAEDVDSAAGLAVGE